MTLELFGHWLIGLAVLIDALAAVVYLWAGDWQRGVYWLGAGIATACTIKMKGR